MRKQIVHISIHQTSKVIAAMHAVMIAVIFVLPTFLGHLFNGQVIMAFAILIFIPLLLWLLMYIGYVIACWFYNLVVPWTGGIEFNLVDLDVQPRMEHIVADSSPPSPPSEPSSGVNPDKIDRL
jgi:hypothetical protein